MIRLRIQADGEETHRTFRRNTVVIGRSRQCDLSLPDARGVSRFHCRIVLREGRCFLEDLGSRNLTLVNSRPLQHGELAAGDVLKLGATELRLEIVRDEEPTEELVQPCLHCGHLFGAGRDLCPRCGTEIKRRSKSRTIGELAFPGFRLLRKIGSGGMGIVFEAQELEKDRRVALKALRPHLARNLAYLARFIEEIRVLTALRHPSIVEIYGRGKEGDLHYLYMELVEGRSARELLRDLGALPWREAVRIAWESAKALHAAYHQAGVVHGDVKPGNFLLGQSGQVKLCDFGLARIDLRGRPTSSRWVEEEQRGTAAYAAPERFAEEGRPSVAGDIYSLGVSIFQMATGQLPFQAASTHALRHAHLNQPVPQMSTFRPGINAGLQILVERMMEKDPKRRLSDYPALISDFCIFLS